MSIADGGGGLLSIFGGFFGGGGGSTSTNPELSAAVRNQDEAALRNAWAGAFADAGYIAPVASPQGPGDVVPPPSTPDVIASTPPPIRIPTTEIIEAPPGLRGPLQNPIFYDPVPYKPPKKPPRFRIPTAAAVARVLRGAAGGAVAGTLGILWPTDLGNSDLFDPKAKKRTAQRVLNRPGKRVTARPRMPGNVVSPIPMPSLPPIAPERVLLEEIRPTARRLPTVQSPTKAPRAPTRPATRRPSPLGFLTPSLGDLTGLLLLASRGQRIPTPRGQRYVDPLSLTQTPIENRPAPTPGVTPLTGSFIPGVPYTPRTSTQYCEPRPRKPTRKCVERDDCNKCVRYAPL